MRRELFLFCALIAAVALGNGLSDALYSNYFKEVYHITAMQRAFIEFPRELPGILCAFIIAALSMIGDLKIALIAQILATAGLLILGVFTPPFAIMLIFLFINSLGMHLFMPLQDSIGLSMAEPDQVGRRMGQFGSLRTACGLVAALVVFFGFRFEIFSFATPVKHIFLIGVGFFLVAIVINLRLLSKHKVPKVRRGFQLALRREYRYFYLLAMLHGVKKQIAFVFGSWVVVDLLLKGADVMSLLTISASFLGIFFINMLGRWIDRFGIRNMLFVEAFAFILVYIVYGFVVWGITSTVLPSAGMSVMVVYSLFVLDRLSMQITMVRAVYLKNIALVPEDVTAALSTGISLDHIVSIIAAQLSGLVWTQLGPQWVFFMAAVISLGDLFVALKVKDTRKLAAKSE